MADLKISALTGATTPLAGTEVLPIVQSSTTKKVSIANVTAGRAVQGASFEATTIGTGFFTKSGANTLFEIKYSGGFVLNRLTGTDFFIAENNSGQLIVRQTTGNVELGAGDLRFNAAGKGIIFAGNSSVLWRCGAGTPEGAVTAPIGSLYTRTDGGANTTLYVKESGTGNTGWVAK